MKSPAILALYAVFLAACGLAAFAMSGFAANARTALIVGFGTAFVIAICALLANMFHKNKAAGMIGIHAGLILPLIFAGLFGWRAWKSYADPAKLYLAVILAVMSLGSVIVFAMLVKARPKAAMRD
jgi:predicted transporter